MKKIVFIIILTLCFSVHAKQSNLESFGGKENIQTAIMEYYSALRNGRYIAKSIPNIDYIYLNEQYLIVYVEIEYYKQKDDKKKLKTKKKKYLIYSSGKSEDLIFSKFSLNKNKIDEQIQSYFLQQYQAGPIPTIINDLGLNQQMILNSIIRGLDEKSYMLGAIKDIKFQKISAKQVIANVSYTTLTKSRLKEKFHYQRMFIFYKDKQEFSLFWVTDKRTGNMNAELITKNNTRKITGTWRMGNSGANLEVKKGKSRFTSLTYTGQWQEVIGDSGYYKIKIKGEYIQFVYDVFLDGWEKIPFLSCDECKNHGLKSSWTISSSKTCC